MEGASGLGLDSGRSPAVLAVIETSGNQEYVFATNRLRRIEGVHRAVPDAVRRGATDDAELDVLVRVGWRVTLLSCDTPVSGRRWTANHKGKAIESVARARQIGGDAAGTGLVALLEHEGVDAVSSHLPPTKLNAPSQVFGRDDLLRWLDGDHADLPAWCTK